MPLWEIKPLRRKYLEIISNETRASASQAPNLKPYDLHFPTARLPSFQLDPSFHPIPFLHHETHLFPQQTLSTRRTRTNPIRQIEAIANTNIVNITMRITIVQKLAMSETRDAVRDWVEVTC